MGSVLGAYILRCRHAADGWARPGRFRTERPRSSDETARRAQTFGLPPAPCPLCRGAAHSRGTCELGSTTLAPEMPVHARASVSLHADLLSHYQRASLALVGLVRN